MQLRFWRRTPAPDLPPLAIDPGVGRGPEQELDESDPIEPPESTVTLVQARDALMKQSLQSIRDVTWPTRKDDVPSD